MIMAEKSTLDEEALQQIYTWIDDIPLSRAKKNITRDFSDGVLIAEIIHHFIPKMVDLHNYTAASSSTTKLDNWNLLSRKCFTKLSYNIEEDLVKGAVSCKAGIIELILQDLRHHIESYLACKKAASLVEKQKYHDEVNVETYNYESADPYHVQNGYSGIANGYGYAYAGEPPPGVTDPNYHPHYPYQYQSQPIAAMSDHPPSLPAESDDSLRSNTDHAPKPRKPVTQASKIKAKQSITGQPKAPPGTGEVSVLRIALEEKEQALLASQETVQILQAKIRRLEHLLHLKDLRINEIKNQSSASSNMTNVQLTQQTSINQPRHLPPSQNFPIHPPHGFNNFPPRPPLPQIPRPPQEDSRKFQR